MATQPLDRRRPHSPPSPGGAKSQSSGGVPPSAALTNLITHPWLVLVGLITASIMEVLDTTIINVALPTMAGNFSATTDEIAWVVTGYILSNVVVLPMTAWLAQRFGRKRYLVTSIGIFIASSFMCGTSHGLGELVFWRIVQGAGGAALLSTAQATLRQIFPAEKQGTVQAIFILGIVVAPTLGPTLGGYITDNYNWPWVFFINVPIGLLSMFLVSAFLHDAPGTQKKTGGVDWLGISLLAVGLGSLQYVLEEGKRYDWFDSVAITRLSILAGVTLIALVVWELWPTNKHPIVDFHVLRNRELTSGLVLFLALGFGLYGGIFIFPLFVQNILGFSPTATGLVLLPGGIATAVSVVICGRLMNGKKVLVDPRILIFTGIAIFMVSMWMLGHLTVASGEPDTRLALIFRGFGLGFLFTPINFVVFAALKGPEIAQGSSFINLARQLGGSFGIAALNTYISDQADYHRANLVSYLYSGNSEVMARETAQARNLLAHGYNAAQAQAGALGTLNATVQKQAQTMAFNDAFLLLLLSFVLAAPAVFLLGKVKRPPPGGGGGGH